MTKSQFLNDQKEKYRAWISARPMHQSHAIEWAEQLCLTIVEDIALKQVRTPHYFLSYASFTAELYSRIKTAITGISEYAICMTHDRLGMLKQGVPEHVAARAATEERRRYLYAWASVNTYLATEDRTGNSSRPTKKGVLYTRYIDHQNKVYFLKQAIIDKKEYLDEIIENHEKSMATTRTGV